MERHVCPYSRHYNTLVWSWILDEEHYWQKRMMLRKKISTKK
jgi:hypothetical protein